MSQNSTTPRFAPSDSPPKKINTGQMIAAIILLLIGVCLFLIGGYRATGGLGGSSKNDSNYNLNMGMVIVGIVFFIAGIITLAIK